MYVFKRKIPINLYRAYVHIIFSWNYTCSGIYEMYICKKCVYIYIPTKLIKKNSKLIYSRPKCVRNCS